MKIRCRLQVCNSRNRKTLIWRKQTMIRQYFVRISHAKKNSVKNIFHVMCKTDTTQKFVTRKDDKFISSKLNAYCLNLLVRKKLQENYKKK